MAKKTKTQDDRLPVVVYGAGGYGGVGLVENLLHHPGVRIAALVSRDGAGSPYSDLYPHLKGRLDAVVEAAESFDPAGRGRVVFFSTPDGVGQSLARRYLELGYRIIDFSGDFRFRDEASYGEYSSRQHGQAGHACAELLSRASYGCPELHREALKKADLVGNPGCMAVGCILAMAPAFRAGLVEAGPVICDVKTGISGAGKKPKPAFHFPPAQANAYAYKVGRHQHVFEIERELSSLAGRPVKLDFTPHVIPVSRGILSTCYLRLKKGVGRDEAVKAYCDAYRDEPFVLFDASGRPPELGDVRGANQCRLSVQVVERTGALIALSAIDNLQKGQAGNAVQVMNLMCGFPEKAGLDIVVRHP